MPRKKKKKKRPFNYIKCPSAAEKKACTESLRKIEPKRKMGWSSG